MRVAILGFLHESNTFLSVPTLYEDFLHASLTSGEAMIERWKGSHHELGGMIAGCEEMGIEIAAGMATFAVPSGTITEESYERIASELIASLQNVLPVDGVLIALHGATVSDRYRDADGEILRRIRSVVGSEMPVIVTLDLHANISEEMVRTSTALIAYRTNPHLDQYERGHEAARMMAGTLRGKMHPVQALVKPPLLIQLSRQYSEEAPTSILYENLKEVLLWPGILSASVTLGFYYADVEEMGMAFVAVADGDFSVAQRAATSLADQAWQSRAQFTAGLPNAAKAVKMAKASCEKPVVVMDIGDNVGGGSPGDSTFLLSELIEQGSRNSLNVLYDPSSVQQCLQVGVGGAIALAVGAKTDRLHGQPVHVEGRIRTLSDGIFVEKQVRHGGWGGGDQGITAVLETVEEHTIVLTSKRMMPMSLEQVLSLGIHPEWKDVIVVKGVNAPRAAYAPIAGKIILAGTAGVTCDDPSHFHYTHRRKPLFPLEKDAVFLENR